MDKVAAGFFFLSILTCHAKPSVGESKRWFQDLDKDGYGNKLVSVVAKKKPEGFSGLAGDCNDQDSETYPGQKKWFRTPQSNGSFDYDCDGIETLRYKEIGSCGGFPLCDQLKTLGWVAAIPKCGVKAEWMEDCDYRNPFVCEHERLPHCDAETKVEIQECH